MYTLPSLKELRSGQPHLQHTKANDEVIAALQQVFAEFAVDCAVTGFSRGPTVTRYEVTLGAGVKVERITQLTRNIAYAVKSPDVRIISPIPGKSAVGVEIPNADPEVVMLGDVLRAPVAQRDQHPMLVALGKDVEGGFVVANLTKMPHLLVAGATGAGKSSCINSLILSVLTRATPDQVRMVLIDPKRVEFAAYQGIPHLVTPGDHQPEEGGRRTAAGSSARWTCATRTWRPPASGTSTTSTARCGAGELATPPGSERVYTTYPYLLVIVDELADLMMVAPRDVEDAVVRITQLARAAGIHLVIATQRPVGRRRHRADQGQRAVPARVQDLIADRLSGHPRPAGGGEVARQGRRAVPADGRVEAGPDPGRVRHRRRDPRDRRALQAAACSRPTARTSPPPHTTKKEIDEDIGDDLELFLAAVELVVSTQFGSTSMLQRKLRVGFAKAGRLMDLMESRGIVGPSEGSKARDVLVKPDELAGLLYALRSGGSADDLVAANDDEIERVEPA